MVVFYREDELAKRDHLLMLHQEFLSLVLQQASSLLEGMVEQQRPILELLDFVIKLLSCTLNRSSEVNGEIFDLTLAIELSFFIRDLTKHLYSLVSSKKIKFSEH